MYRIGRAAIYIRICYSWHLAFHVLYGIAWSGALRGILDFRNLVAANDG